MIIGSSEKSREEDNPFSFEERKELIEECFDISINRLEDEGKDEKGNRKWADKLEELVGEETLVSGNELVQRICNEYTDIDVREPDYTDPGVYSGTKIRRRVRSGEEWLYLVPECSADRLENFIDIIKDSGREYEFEPGWKKENAYHGTADK